MSRTQIITPSGRQYMKRGSNTSLPDRVSEMSIKGLIMTVLILLTLIALVVLIATLI